MTTSSDSTRPHDRAPVEDVTGHPVTRPWPQGALTAGSRVKVIRDPEWDGPWKNEFSGTIDDMGAPEPVDHPQAQVAELKYWVSFDAPQHDSGGDGPYRKAQIWGRYLLPEPTPVAQASP
ncbi:ferrous iron transport protein A [Streptomyces sp. NPDC053792]|uniref:ferrous iron transport protein A n=1 Tax=Streptomyces sp. NPDC053792 TaxID=3365716 RepID=UPI0037D0584C